jgi:hypothetical protein
MILGSAAKMLSEFSYADFRACLLSSYSVRWRLSPA